MKTPGELSAEAETRAGIHRKSGARVVALVEAGRSWLT